MTIINTKVISRKFFSQKTLFGANRIYETLNIDLINENKNFILVIFEVIAIPLNKDLEND